MTSPTFVRAGACRLAAWPLPVASSGAADFVAVHGFLDHAGSFAPLAAALSARSFWALDLPGHGASQDLGGRPYQFVDFVADLVRALEALAPDPVVLVGHSLGAGLAAFAAALAPERVGALVLLDGLGPLVEPPEALPDRLARALREEDRLRRAPPKIYPTVDDARRTFEAVRAELGPRAVDALLPGSLDRVRGGVRWAADPLVRAPSRLRLTEAHVEAFLRRVACPVLVVEPERGILAKAGARAEARRACLRQVERAEVPGGHHAHLERPEAVARAVASFVARRWNR